MHTVTAVPTEGKLPYKVSPGSDTGQAMGEIGETLARYNSGPSHAGLSRPWGG